MLSNHLVSLKGCGFTTANANLLLANVHADSILLETDDWCPEILRGSILRLFLGLTIVVALILAVLLALFCKSPIFEPLLIPESSQNFNDRAVIALAPYSVIPALISLIVLLCWASVVETFRGLQPYVSMARKAFLDSRNPSSYINIPLLWTIATATLNRDFLLAVVAVCAVLSQICEHFHQLGKFSRTNDFTQ
jgi:hypothetical protein